MMRVRYSSTWWSLLWQPARSCHTSPRRASGTPLRTRAGSCLGRTDRLVCLQGRERTDEEKPEEARDTHRGLGRLGGAPADV